MNILEPIVITTPVGSEEECAVFIIDDTTTSFKLTNVMVARERYTIGFWIQSNENGSVRIGGKTIDTTTEWTRHVVNFTATSSTLEIIFNVTGTYKMYNTKLENGDKGTTWTPAPEDVSEEIDKASAEAHDEIAEQTTQLLQNTQEIILSAIKPYVRADDGVRVTDVVTYYISSANDVKAPSVESEWTTDIPLISYDSPYLWTRELLRYSDDSIVEQHPVIIASFESSQISSITELYGVNSDKERPILTIVYDDGTTMETDLNWVSEIPELSMTDSYLWHYKIIHFADGTNVVTDKRLIGDYRYSYSEFKKVVETQLSMLAGSITMSFESVSNNIKEVDDRMIAEHEEISKYFVFSENGLVIKSGENAMQIKIDNDIISFYKGDIDESDLSINRLGYWDGVDFYTGNIYVEVEKRAQFGNFAFIPRSDGSLMFTKVGDNLTKN